jgi:hypothetical protein
LQAAIGLQGGEQPWDTGARGRRTEALEQIARQLDDVSHGDAGPLAFERDNESHKARADPRYTMGATRIYDNV